MSTQDLWMTAFMSGYVCLCLCACVTFIIQYVYEHLEHYRSLAFMVNLM